MSIHYGLILYILKTKNEKLIESPDLFVQLKFPMLG